MRLAACILGRHGRSLDETKYKSMQWCQEWIRKLDRNQFEMKLPEIRQGQAYVTLVKITRFAGENNTICWWKYSSAIKTKRTDQSIKVSATSSASVGANCVHQMFLLLALGIFSAIPVYQCRPSGDKSTMKCSLTVLYIFVINKESFFIFQIKYLLPLFLGNILCLDITRLCLVEYVLTVEYHWLWEMRSRHCLALFAEDPGKIVNVKKYETRWKQNSMLEYKWYKFDQLEYLNLNLNLLLTLLVLFYHQKKKATMPYYQGNSTDLQ